VTKRYKVEPFLRSKMSAVSPAIVKTILQL